MKTQSTSEYAEGIRALLRPIAVIIAFAGLLSLAGCSWLRSPQSKTALLEKSLKEFKNALYWNSFDQVSSFAEPADRTALMHDIKAARNSEKVVRIDVRGVELSKDEVQADVDLVINFFKVPQYVVASRVERYTWIYDGLRDTWFVKTIEILPADHEPVDVQGVLGVY